VNAHSLGAVPVVSCVVLSFSNPNRARLLTILCFGASIQQLTGRGGAGNFRSPSREPVPGERGPDDYSDTRGRDPIPSGDPNVVCDLLLLLLPLVSDTKPTRCGINEMKVISTGRGGRGNIRSPSRDGVRGDDASREASLARSEQRGRGYDRELISTIDNAHDPGVVRGCRYLYKDFHR
jgi:hypothetical protein